MGVDAQHKWVGWPMYAVRTGAYVFSCAPGIRRRSARDMEEVSGTRMHGPSLSS